ncbi:hypothetical protein BV22DRAFT_1051300 [Leucogyrophana mollusca]|uniref:Uncharacterized protein n=1 Tax=Leucogyrophana mollusca TaxID=85980 RepID=A0ACB8B2X0_9AGAM|nr:hypothetical protein BV22DRAFT_1051300 [Leucogyrophana mollusca]
MSPLHHTIHIFMNTTITLKSISKPDTNTSTTRSGSPLTNTSSSFALEEQQCRTYEEQQCHAYEEQQHRTYEEQQCCTYEEHLHQAHKEHQHHTYEEHQRLAHEQRQHAVRCPRPTLSTTASQGGMQGLQSVGSIPLCGVGVQLIAAYTTERPLGGAANPGRSQASLDTEPQLGQYRDGVISVTETHSTTDQTTSRCVSLPFPQETIASPTPQASEPVPTPSTSQLLVPSATQRSTMTAWKVAIPPTLLPEDVFNNAKEKLKTWTLNVSGFATPAGRASRITEMLQEVAAEAGLNPPYKWAHVFSHVAKLCNNFKDIAHCLVMLGCCLQLPICDMDSEYKHKKTMVLQLIEQLQLLNVYEAEPDSNNVFVCYLKNNVLACLILDVAWLGGCSSIIDPSNMDKIFALAGTAIVKSGSSGTFQGTLD